MVQALWRSRALLAPGMKTLHTPGMVAPSTADFNLLILFLAFSHALPPHAHSAALSSSLLQCLELTSSLPTDSPHTLTPDPENCLCPEPWLPLSPAHPALADSPKGSAGTSHRAGGCVGRPCWSRHPRLSGQEPADIPVDSGAAGACQGARRNSPHQAGSS